MPRVSRQSAANVEQHGPVVEDRHEDVGDTTIQFLTFNMDADGGPLLKGLPDDRCPCAHWGYVFKGRITFQFADHEETFEAGDAFYVPAGHSPVIEAGTEYLQFSPARELHEVSETMTRNAQALQMI
jgi:mannose-6-phosphate isomerase-like protein (cupin superfamily)